MVGSLVVSGDWEVGLRRKAWRARSNEGRMGACFLAGMVIGRGLGTAAWGKAAEFEKAGAVGEKPQGCADSALRYGRYWRVCSMSLVVGA